MYFVCVYVYGLQLYMLFDDTAVGTTAVSFLPNYKYTVATHTDQCAFYNNTTNYLRERNSQY